MPVSPEEFLRRRGKAYADPDGEKTNGPADGLPEERRGDAWEHPEDRQSARETFSGSPGKKDDSWPELIPLANVPPADPFPVHVFPNPLRNFITEASAALDCPPDFLGVPMLAVAGAMIGASRSLRLKSGYFQSARIYSAVVGEPSSAKTPALDLVREPLVKTQLKYKAKFGEEMKKYEEDLELYKKADKERTDEAAEKPLEKPPKPVLVRCWSDDSTSEALAFILEQNPRGVALVRDELLSWVLSMNQYKGGRGADRQFFLSCWSGEPAAGDRKGNPDRIPIIIPHPFLCVVGGLPPDMLGLLRDQEGRADGFIDRFLFGYPDPRGVAEWSTRGVSDATKAEWARVLEQLVLLGMLKGENGTWRPATVELTGDGNAEWKMRYNEHVGEMRREGFPNHLRSYWGKLRGYAGRLALILQLVRSACYKSNEESVDADSVRSAWELVSYFKAMYRRVCGQMHADEEIGKARRVLRWIEREKRSTFKRWEVHKDLENEKEFPRLEDLDGPLARLVKHGYIREHIPQYKGKGRPPDPIFEVRPELRRTAE